MAEESSRRRLALAALGATAASLTLVGLRYRWHRPGSPYLAGSPLLIAHRGGSHLAPENTLLAFDRALRWWGADILELDVHPTRDGEAVVIHDATVDRTTEGSGAVAEQTLDLLKSLDAGFRFTPDGGMTHPFRGRGLQIPTLAEVLHDLPLARVNIEIKDGRVQQRVREVVREANARHRVLIAAGKTRNRGRFNREEVAVSAGEGEMRTFIAQLRIGRVVYTPAVDAFQLPDRWEGREIPTSDLIEAAHARNIAVHVWTVDEVDRMTALLDRGVDGIVTDRPDRLARLLHDRVGRPRPPGPPSPPPEEFLERLLRE